MQTTSTGCCACTCHEPSDDVEEAVKMLCQGKNELFQLFKFYVSCSQYKCCDVILADEAPLEYWKQLAEARREALEDSLSENKSVSDNLTP